MRTNERLCGAQVGLWNDLDFSVHVYATNEAVHDADELGRVGGRRGGVQGSLVRVRRFRLRARIGTPSLRLRPPPRRTGQADFRHPAHREGVITSAPRRGSRSRRTSTLRETRRRRLPDRLAPRTPGIVARRATSESAPGNRGGRVAAQ